MNFKMSHIANSASGGGTRPASSNQKNPSEKKAESVVNYDAVGRCVCMEVGAGEA
jgi:hypothetical protein